MWLSERARRRQQRNGVSLWLGATMLLGLFFLYGEVQEYRKLLHENVTVSRDLFGSTYYTLTGFHALHVTIGLILLGTAVSFALRDRMGAKQQTAMTCISYYWHLVDAVWVIVFSTVYISGRPDDDRGADARRLGDRALDCCGILCGIRDLSLEGSCAHRATRLLPDGHPRVVPLPLLAARLARR